MFKRVPRASSRARAAAGPWRLLLMTTALIAPVAAAAYQLNPLKDRHRGGQLSGFGRGVDSVHEDITHAAIRCARAAGAADPVGAKPICREPVRHRTRADEGNIRNPLIVGLWWNDDPRQFLFGKAVINAALQWSDAQHSARLARRSGGRHRHPAMQKLLYRSHFGDLQFLHAMAARDGEPPALTQQRILAWFAFAYSVATGAMSPDTRLGQLAPPLRDSFAADWSWTVEQLFKPRSGMKHLPLGELALGTMLHVAQDSYSSSHATRNMAPSPACAAGSVTGFHFFLGQDTAQHRAADSRAALHHDTAARFTALQNPVEASARLILLTRRRADWATVVEPYLRSTLFCLDPSAP